MDLLDSIPTPPARQPIGPGAVILRGFARDAAPALIAAIEAISTLAPFRHMHTPGGHRMSVAMTNCGALGWITGPAGYRYGPADPQTGRPWPAMPHVLATLATDAAAQAGFPGFHPDACLMNRYQPGARLTPHQDRNERDMAAPIVSVSLGLPATFLWGGVRRADALRRFRLLHADIVVWGGPARLVFHGVDTLAEGDHPATGRHRFNLTFRRAG